MANDQKNAESFPVEEDHKKEDVAPPAIKDHEKDPTESHPIENIVLLGRTGNGKSATGNSIARQKVFISKSHAAGVTLECQAFRAVAPEGPILNIIDTPGLFDLSVAADVISKEIVRCLTLAEGGIHAAVLVLSARTRFSKEEEMVLTGDVLEEDGVTLDEYLEDCPDYLKRVLILCGQRMTLFDNRTKDSAKQTKQIKEENDRHQKELEDLEAKGRSEEEVQALRKELELTREENLKEMTAMMEKNIKMAAEAQEKLFELKEKTQQQLYEEREKSVEQSNRDKLAMQEYLNKMNEQMRRNMEDQMRRQDAGCNIL